MDLSNLNWLLVCIAGIVIINVINGLKKGFVKELIDCISLMVLSLVIVLLSAVLKNYTDRQFVQMIVLIIMVLILVLGYKLIKSVLGGIKILASLPVISTFNKLAGGIFGILETIVFVWFFFCLIGMFELGVISEYINTYIQNSQLLTYLYDNNIIASLVEQIMGEGFQMKALDVIINQGIELTSEIL